MPLSALLVLLAACDAPPPDAAGAPVILVSLDTLRADRLGAYGNPDGLTPNLDHFAREAVLFEHAYAQATSTAPSHASLFTSRYASEEDLSDRRPGLDGKPTLAEVLGAYGWTTAAFVAGGDLSPELGVGRGFGTWESIEDFGSLWHTAPPALAWLDARGADEKWLLFVHGYDAHTPYLKPTPYGFAVADASHQGVAQAAAFGSTERVVDGHYLPDFRAFATFQKEEPRPRSAAARGRFLERAKQDGPVVPLSDADLDYVRDLYDGGVAYGDAQFGLFMAELEARGVLDRATVIVLSDHGEQLGEDGIFSHCCGAGDEETHVVLMTRLPGGVGGGRRVSGLVELVDVMPTIVELAGAQSPSGARGVSLVPALRGEPFAGRAVAFTQGGAGMRSVGARSAKGRLVWSGIQATSAYAPDLEEAAALPGPGFVASEGLAAEDQAALKTAIAAWLRTLDRATGEATAAPLSLELKKELREHGYFEAGE